MTRAIAAASLAVLAAACAAGKDKTAATPTQDGEALRAEVEKIVRSYADDPLARVSITKNVSNGVCGDVATRGETRAFYADFVDGEAFFADGYMDAVVEAAC